MSAPRGAAGIRRALEQLRSDSVSGMCEHRTPLYMDVFFKELENIRREEAGEDPLPYTEEEREYQREAARRLLEEYIPHLMREEVSGESRQQARQLEAHIKQHLEELHERRTP